jgi:chitinase
VASAAYALQVASLTFSPGSGTYTQPQTVSMSTTTSGTTIRYTTDGTTPTTSSPAYPGPMSIATSTTIRAMGFRDGWSPSSLIVRTLTMNFGTLSAPTYSPAGGTYQNSVVVTIANEQPNATIHYTTDGSTPGTWSPVYT